MPAQYRNSNDIISAGDIWYRVNRNSNNASVIGRFKEAPAVLSIPESIKVNNRKYEVTEIGDRAFCDSNEDDTFTSLIEIVLPQSIQRIGEHAFSNRRADLLDVNIPDGCEVSETAFE